MSAFGHYFEPILNIGLTVMFFFMLQRKYKSAFVSILAGSILSTLTVTLWIVGLQAYFNTPDAQLGIAVMMLLFESFIVSLFLSALLFVFHFIRGVKNP